VVVKPSYGLADEQIAQMLKDGFANAEATWRRASCARRASRPSAWCWPRAPRWQADGDLLSRRRRRAPSTTAVKALAEGTEAFAAARMNQGIRQALAGRRLEEV
jgi:molecular chaperone HscA